MVERAVPRLRRGMGSPELLAEEEMAFSSSDMSGRERKKEGAAQAVQGVLLFSMGSKQRC
jgi:hypothetical protein